MKTIVLAAVAAASLSAAPAFAQSNAPARIEISSAGLDLTTAQGRATFDLRVLHAARSACGTPSSADLQGRSKADACVADVRLAANAQRDVLIAAAQQQAGRTLAGR